MKTSKTLLLSVLCVAPWIVSGAGADINPTLYLDDVKYLASPEMRGRATGSPELEKAADFIAHKFREFGLQPVDGKSYFQSFRVTTSAQLGKANHFRVTSHHRVTSLRFPDDFIPLHFSTAAKLKGSMVFAGYGITAPEFHYDDYAGLEVQGKIVVLLRHEPQELDEKSVFAGKNYTEHSKLSSKASNAKMHGAAAVILINDTVHHHGDPDEL